MISTANLHLQPCFISLHLLHSLPPTFNLTFFWGLFFQNDRPVVWIQLDQDHRVVQVLFVWAQVTGVVSSIHLRHHDCYLVALQRWSQLHSWNTDLVQRCHGFCKIGRARWVDDYHFSSKIWACWYMLVHRSEERWTQCRDHKAPSGPQL